MNCTSLPERKKFILRVSSAATRATNFISVTSVAGTFYNLELRFGISSIGVKVTLTQLPLRPINSFFELSEYFDCQDNTLELSEYPAEAWLCHSWVNQGPNCIKKMFHMTSQIDPWRSNNR